MSRPFCWKLYTLTVYVQLREQLRWLALLDLGLPIMTSGILSSSPQRLSLERRQRNYPYFYVSKHLLLYFFSLAFFFQLIKIFKFKRPMLLHTWKSKVLILSRIHSSEKCLHFEILNRCFRFRRYSTSTCSKDTSSKFLPAIFKLIDLNNFES